MLQKPLTCYYRPVPDEPSKGVTPSRLSLPPDALALLDSSVPKIYANGFSIGLTNADTQIVLMLFGRPIAVLSLSYTLAKTLSGKLSYLVSEWEKRTGHPLQTTDSIDKVFGEGIDAGPSK